ncbi:acetyl-CoA carboxylase biotin carboxylase subunit [Bacillus sp. FJAT-44742]|uniref:acetyl-CoA carboxylase biotin carboxylase subunit n=1 Tax=Bacillus sp. FJAT-44742 TaxID=2014005 RepID=UPI000C232047|nr:acetyl-CoA carboxylase biotin carboxylase subunit [Bacillus sp. FJAT-44742]
MFKKILVANRGEIAIRIIRACKEMNIQSVAVYSETDKDALHVKTADEAYCIGPAQASESYLHMENIISAALLSNADAIHPGYGFLSEQPKFVELCEAVNLTFIGPSSEAIRKMGEKAEARKTMKSAGVPTVPGTEGVIEELEEVRTIAEKIGYPVIAKASAGGGGKGMRKADNKESLEKAVRQAQNEAKSIFGDGGVYVEKFIEEPRHIEVQLLADRHGNVVHLGERDCSIQRRHQKLIEEAPSPALNLELREKMGEASIKAAKAVNYCGAGTVEFLLDKHNRFYFMEMNTRIQVEHPVTEMVTRVDIVKEQISVAAGEPLSFTQEEVILDGHSIECRINAEDPEKNFRPSPGEITEFAPPQGFGMRIDTAVYKGYEITPFYDSMVAKLIVWGKTREEAISRMKRGLTDLKIGNIQTTIPLHLQIIENSQFQTGAFDTSFMEHFLDQGSSVKK